MKLNTYDAPHIRHQENTRALMGDVAITLLFLYAMAFYYYGPRALVLGLVSVLAAWTCDILCVLMAGGRPNARDLSPLVTGMLLPLMMPASIEYHIVIIAAVFAIAVAKHPFGGVGHNVFNPTAAGLSFVAICFTDKMFLYPLPLYRLPVFGPLDAGALVNAPAFTLDLGGTPAYDFVEMALGNFPGPMGATNILVILTCLLYLVFRGTVRWEAPFSFFLASAASSFLIRLAEAGSGPAWPEQLRMVPYEMMSGILLLGGVYMLGDPVTTPTRKWSRLFFGFASGVVVILFRRYGGLEEEFTFAILLMNASAWGLDMLGERLAGGLRRRRAA